MAWFLDHLQSLNGTQSPPTSQSSTPASSRSENHCDSYDDEYIYLIAKSKISISFLNQLPDNNAALAELHLSNASRMAGNLVRIISAQA